MAVCKYKKNLERKGVHLDKNMAVLFNAHNPICIRTHIHMHMYIAAGENVFLIC